MPRNLCCRIVEKNLNIIINKDMIVNKNYYEILEVAIGCDEVELKTAYRRLARKFHPDVCGDDGRFKDISKAYDVLSDKQKRLQYDTVNGFFKSAKTSSAKKESYQSEPQRAKSESSEEATASKLFTDAINEMFNEYVKASGSKRKPTSKKEKPAPKNGTDVYADVSVTFKDSIEGTTRTVNVLHTHTCPKCQGRKFINKALCPECDGKGEANKHKKISVTIPAGIKNGGKLRIKGEGNEGSNGGKNGDLYLIVKIEGCSRIKYEGADIHYSVPITPFEAALGADIEIPFFGGNISLKIPPHTHSGQKFRLAGQGGVNVKDKSNLGAGKSGDMIVTVCIEIPSSLSDDETRLYEKLRKASTCDIRENLLNE